jgi:glycopeptide antibiotics resistance protein
MLWDRLPRPLRVAVWGGFAVYLVALAYVTLAPRWGTSGAIGANFVPFASIVDLLSGTASRLLVAKNLLGNLALLMPLAAVLTLALSWMPKRVISVCLATSVGIEVVQGLGLTDGRGANVDDVLLNVLGAALVSCGLWAASRKREAVCA